MVNHSVYQLAQRTATLALMGWGIAGCGQGPAAMKTDATSVAMQSDRETCPADGMGDTRQVNLKVPSMHCPYGCYPAVQETLTAVPGVKKVELVPQAEEGKIDDPRVTVTYQGEFDAKAAVEALATASFPGAAVDRQ